MTEKALILKLGFALLSYVLPTPARVKYAPKFDITGSRPTDGVLIKFREFG